MGKNLSVLLEEDVHGVSVSSTQNSPSSSTAGAQPTQHVSSFLGFSEPMSAEVWTLSRSSARQIDSGHSSSLTNSSSCQQQKQSKGSDITESSFLDSDISKRCVWNTIVVMLNLILNPIHTMKLLSATFVCIIHYCTDDETFVCNFTLPVAFSPLKLCIYA